MRLLTRVGGLVLGCALAAGCATSPATTAPAATSQPAAQPAASQPAPAATKAPAQAAPAAQPAAQSTAPTALPSGVTLREEKDFGQVWLAPGFDFKGYDTLLVTDARAEVPKVNPDGVANLEWARGVVPTQLAAALQERKLFTVVRSPTEVKPGSRVLRLDTTIIEYEKGGGGARMFGFSSTAGQPVIKVRGQATVEGRPLFVYEARRSGASTSAKMFGGYRGDKDIQEEDIKDLAKGLGNFIAKTKGP